MVQTVVVWQQAFAFVVVARSVAQVCFVAVAVAVLVAVLPAAAVVEPAAAAVQAF